MQGIAKKKKKNLFNNNNKKRNTSQYPSLTCSVKRKHWQWRQLPSFELWPDSPHMLGTEWPVGPDSPAFLHCERFSSPTHFISDWFSETEQMVGALQLPFLRHGLFSRWADLCSYDHNEFPDPKQKLMGPGKERQGFAWLFPLISACLQLFLSQKGKLRKDQKIPFVIKEECI